MRATVPSFWTYSTTGLEERRRGQYAFTPLPAPLTPKRGQATRPPSPRSVRESLRRGASAPESPPLRSARRRIIRSGNGKRTATPRISEPVGARGGSSRHKSLFRNGLWEHLGGSRGNLVTKVDADTLTIQSNMILRMIKLEKLHISIHLIMVPYHKHGRIRMF